jgi:hypothetical protein
MRKLALAFSMVFLAMTAALTASGSPAFAATPGAAATQAAAATSSAAHASQSRVEGALVLDCTHMSAAAHRYAVAHHYCGPNSPKPNDTVCGNCGCSFIDLFNRSRGYAGMYYGFKSSKGTVIHRSLAVNWANFTKGNAGGWGDSGFMASSSYSADRHVDTHAGIVSAVLSGSVTLWWGASCTLLEPTSTVKVTY